MKRINRPALSNNRRHTLLHPCFFTSLPFYFAASPSSSSFPTSHFALIQLCICILNDSITRDPAVKITDVFHYFTPLGHHDPSLAPITPLPPPPPSSIPLSRPLSLSLSTCPIFLLSHSRPFFLVNVRFCCVYLCDWEGTIAKWSCLWALHTVSWQKVFFR